MLDVDSTLCGIEGIDWLARRRGEDVTRRVAAATERAMGGELPVDTVYGERLALVRPSRRDVEDLADAYRSTLALGAAETIRALRARDMHLILVSGGIRQAIQPLATDLEFEPDELFAVSVHWDEHGEYESFDASSPLTTHMGKLEIVRSAGLPAPVLAVGDGATDLAMREAVAAFAAFTGFVHRAPVVAGADYVFTNFRDLITIMAQG